MEFDFEWDPAKAKSNQSKHGVAFEQASEILRDPQALTVFDEAHSAHEERWFTLGVGNQGKLLAVAHTFMHTSPDRARVRIISARDATKAERRQYENEPR